jgi:hypothetical protein
MVQRGVTLVRIGLAAFLCQLLCKSFTPPGAGLTRQPGDLNHANRVAKPPAQRLAAIALAPSGHSVHQ